MDKKRRAAPPGEVEKRRVWRLNIWEIAATFGVVGGISFVTAWLFYDCIWVMAAGILIFYPALLFANGFKEKRRRKQLNLEFKDYMYGISSALLAGYSMENAFVESQREVKELYGEKSILLEELGNLKQRLGMQENLEKILKEFAEKSGCEDIESFVEVFCFAKRGGGDFLGIIQTTIRRICDKTEVAEEIETTIAQKVLEQKVMSVVPIVVLAFFRFSSPEFIGMLYGNPFGVLVMTIVLILYGLAMLWGAKIVEIEV
ncbi:MAG: hypothetical protein NC307_09165 [Roseburia sp.]|nr:hypothetical protein [Roseburia sp.]